MVTLDYLTKVRFRTFMLLKDYDVILTKKFIKRLN